MTSFRHAIAKIINFSMLGCTLILAQPALAATLKLKVLIVSTGNSFEDAGLDLMDDVLTQMGVPFDVLDSSRETLTASRLYSGAVGNYNGIILTNSELFLPNVGSGFSAAEWAMLQNYERSFGVRESVLSGFPATNPALGLDYGMKNGEFGQVIVAGSNFLGQWKAPAGGPEFLEYMNVAKPFSVNDFAFAYEPFQQYVGEPAQYNGRPLVQPLLTWTHDPAKTLLAIVRHPDGREVLFSTIAQAPFLLHSQALAYEFVNFATRGVFIGARKLYLAAHVDDLFLSNDLWNIERNINDESLQYRMTPGDVTGFIAVEKVLKERYPVMKDMVVDLAFNGFGASPATPVADVRVSAVADTYIASISPDANFGISTQARISYYLLGADRKNYLVKFNLPSSKAKLKRAQLTVKNRNLVNSALSICRVTKAWLEGEGKSISSMGATWKQASLGKPWSKVGGDFDANNCISANSGGQYTSTFDVTPIVQRWVSGSANYGFIIRMQSGAELFVHTREAGATMASSLTLSYEPLPAEPLTASIVSNKNAFRFINHTYSHVNMNTSAGMDYARSTYEIGQNMQMWRQLGLPEAEKNTVVLLTGEHSGLRDTNGTADTSDDLPYPEGRNLSFLQAAFDSGIRYLASDSSQVNQNVEAYVPGMDILLLPRYPTNIFFNTTTPAENVDEYNYIFHERHLLEGKDPCTILGALCVPKDYTQLLASEADSAVRHMLTFRAWPHYFHQTNLYRYNVAGDSLLSDWLKVVAERYGNLFTLPVKSLPYYQIGAEARERLKARAASVDGQIDTAAGTVTVWAKTSALTPVTGVEGGAVYGGQLQRDVSVGVTPVTFRINRCNGLVQCQ